MRFRQPARIRLQLRVSLVALAVMVISNAGRGEPRVDFRQDILPFLSASCFRCHGPDAETREAGLRLDQAESALAVLDSGERAIVPGNPASSELWRRVNDADPDLCMPPEGEGERLLPEQRELLRRWIEAGATYAKHWSFEPPRSRRVPDAVRQAAWPKSTLDRWIVNQLQQHQLRPSPEAEKATLLRRLTLDLTGLPPTPDEVDAFVTDSRPDAYSHAVDRLLASPAYGESDELGFKVTRDKVHVHDLQATIMHLLGFDHERLTYRYQGRDFRLTDVHGQVVPGILTPAY